MIQDRRFALGFRLCALIFACIGIMTQVGVFSGKVTSSIFMYYTIQSNLLVIVLFAMLSVRTAKSLKEGLRGDAGYFPRFEMVCVVNILLTLIVFWAMLAPFVSLNYIMTFENFAVHTITPLFCLADFLLFVNKGVLKYRDVYYTCIFPLFYLIFTAIASFSGYVYYNEVFTEDLLGSEITAMTPVKVPYFFLDYEKLGWMVLVYIIGIMAFIILMGHVFYFVDRKRKKKNF